MTLVKTCHASNMMQDLVKPIHIATTKAVSIIPLLYLKKIESHFETKVMMLSELISHFVAHSFCQLHFCLLFKIVFISHCYHESHRGELF